MDIVRCEDLKTGNWIKLTGLRGETYRQVKSIKMVDEGTVTPIYRVNFYEDGFALMALANREFEMHKTKPVLWTP